MPNVRPLTHILVSTNVPLEYKNLALGSFEDMENETILLQYYPDDARYPNLPCDYYWVYAPAAHGRVLRVLGRDNPEEHSKQFDFIIQSIRSGQFDADKTRIKNILENNGSVRFHIIAKFYKHLSKQFTPWSSQKQEILSKYKPIFNELVRFGAQCHHDKFEMIQDLIQYGMSGEALTRGLLAHVRITPNANTFLEFQRLVNLCLPKGGDINAVLFFNPDFGTFLHYYLAFEYPQAVELIAFIESKRSNKANTQFNYEAQDGFGHTPLLVALLTRNEKAVLALLKLIQKNIKVGINIPDKEGISPLLIAAALGMDEVVKECIRQGADVCAQDKQGRGLREYAQLNTEEVSKLLSRLMHPLRSSNKNSHQHSQLYCIDGDQSTPICLYEDGEEEVTGDAQLPHVVILSNCSPHKERQDRVLEILKNKASKGDEWAQKNLNFVFRQIDDIRFGKKYEAVEIYLKQKKEDTLTVQIGDYMNGLWAQYLPYEVVLDKTMHFLKTKAAKGNLEAISLQQSLQSLIEQTPASAAVLDLSLSGQQKVRSYLQSQEAQASILLSKERNLRRACAFGQVDRLSHLLKEGVNPNHRDHLERSALHYAVMRTDLVKVELIKESEERGEAKPVDLDNRVNQAMRSHPSIIDVLMDYPQLDYQARNKSNNTAMSLLIRDSKEGDPLSQEIAGLCLKKIKTATMQSTVEADGIELANKLTQVSPS